MAYVLSAKYEFKHLPYLPEQGKLRTGRNVVLDRYKETDIPELHSIFKVIVEEGQTYPYESVDTEEEFRKHFLGYDAFVVRDECTNEVLGGFYVKPNYPGRSSHICNGGFIVKNNCQGQGIATYLVPKFLRIASDLGFQASVFNLVYVTNTASLKLWKSFGFKEIGRLPNAGYLKGLGYVDAIQYYYDLTTVPKLNEN